MKRREFITRAAGAAIALPLAGKIPIADAAPLRDDIGFAAFTEEHARNFPLLARALGRREPAYSFRVEWLVRVRRDRRSEREVWHNYTSIFRHAADLRPGQNLAKLKRRLLDEHFQDMESALWFGRRSYVTGTTHPRHTLGGVREFLGRAPSPNDVVALAVLREPRWRVVDYPNGRHTGEWISEVSLRVTPRP